MRNRYFFILCSMLLGSFLFSCNKDLNRPPEHGLTAEEVYSTPEGYLGAFAKVYGAYATTGNAGSGSGDIQGIDPGTSDFFRLYWNAQELTTDEAVVAWGDPGLQDFHNMDWSSSNPMLEGLYYRCMYQITLANDFIRNSSDEAISSHGFKGADADKIKEYSAEARFIRAYQYWVLMDLFGNPPFITEKDPIGSLPKQIKRADLFTYIESELKDIADKLPAPMTNEYGRADQGTAWALLARMYLNAEVYTGTAHYDDAITYAKKVIDAGYTLVPDYQWLFLADNQKSKDEFMLTINYDGLKTQGFGGTTFLTHGSVGGDMTSSDYGIGGGWDGMRATENLGNLFPDLTGTKDHRALFNMNGQTEEIKDLTNFNDGIGVAKFKNITRTGEDGQSLDFSDIDMPLFRLPEMYLIYAEALLRGGSGGDMTTAVGYINKMRERAYGDASGDVASIDLDFILDERGRELYWEGFRRTDLIRYGRFSSGSYLWPWKGGVKSGTGVAAYHNLFPIPTKDLSVNPNLAQNPGY